MSTQTTSVQSRPATSDERVIPLELLDECLDGIADVLDAIDISLLPRPVQSVLSSLQSDGRSRSSELMNPDARVFMLKLLPDRLADIASEARRSSAEQLLDPQDVRIEPNPGAYLEPSPALSRGLA